MEEITVGSHLPAELRKLAEIAHNLWWTWNDDAKKLYCDLDSELWKEVEQNPVLFLERINYEKLVALAHDENFVYKMDAVYSAFKKYVDVEPDHQRPSIAYFSMEYGLMKSLRYIPAVWECWRGLPERGVGQQCGPLCHRTFVPLRLF